MNIKIFYGLIFLWISNLAIGQNGYKIQVNTENLNGHTLYLCYTQGGINFLKITDSVVLKSVNETIYFSQSKKIIEAIRIMYLDNPKNKIDFVLNNGINLIIQINSNKLNQSIFINSAINNDFYKLNEGLKTIPEKFIQLDYLQKKYPNSVLNLYTTFEKYRLQNSSNFNKKNDVSPTNFIKLINWQDKRIALLPNLFSSLNYYMSLNDLTVDSYKKNATQLLDKIDTGTTLYPIVLNWFFKNIEYNEIKNLEPVYIFLASNYLYPTTNISTREYSSIKYNASLFAKLPNGSLVPDFTLVDSSGIAYQLSKIYPNYPFTLIAFFDPECIHCKEKMPEFSKAFNDKNDIFKISILNVVEQKNWLPFLSTANLQNWLNLKCNDTLRAYQSKFNTYANPDFFLVNKSGIIVSKSSNINTLFKIINAEKRDKQ